jgi:hypothetical protein
VTFVRVLAARRLSADTEAVAVADVELDQALTVRGVEIHHDPVHGGDRAVAPRRPWGDQRPVLAWSPRVSAAIVSEVRAQLGDRTAVALPALGGLNLTGFGDVRTLAGGPSDEELFAEVAGGDAPGHCIVCDAPIPSPSRRRYCTATCRVRASRARTEAAS